MKTQIRPARALLLALAPALGLLVLAWQGAYRPERMIVGKWHIVSSGTQHRDEIRFEPDGTFVKETRKLPPISKWHGISSGSQYLTVVRGRYHFTDKSHLHLSPLEVRFNGGLINDAEPPALTVGIAIHGDMADISHIPGSGSTYGPLWKRIQYAVGD